jgi:hypothetical protein
MAAGSEVASLALLVLVSIVRAQVEGGDEVTKRPSIDCGQTNYVGFKGKDFKLGWQYSVGGFSGLVPSVTGTIFVQLQNEKAVALSSSGEKMWEWAIKGASKFNSDDLVYRERNDALVMGWFYPGGPNTIVAMEGKSGKVTWQKKFTTLASTEPITLLNDQNAIVIVNSNDFNSEQYVASLNLDDGSTIWNTTSISYFYVFTRTNVLCDRKTVLLRYSIKNVGGNVIAAIDSSSGKIKWKTSFSWSINKLASSKDVIHATYSPQCLDADVVVGLRPSDGTILWQILSPCKCNGDLSHSHGTAGPAVDERGNAYFSCGNRAYSLDQRGLVRWITPVFEDGWNSCDRALPPSYHPRGFVYMIPLLPQSSLYVLSARTGKIVHTYSLSDQYSRMFLMGNEFIYLIGENVTTIRMERPRED